MISFLILIDANFENTEVYSSQLGFLVVLMNATKKCNIVHYGAVNSKRAERSKLASVLHAAVYGFDSCFVIEKSVKSFLQKFVPVRCYSDYLTLFNSITTLSTTAEKHIFVVLNTLHENIEHLEIAVVYWISGNQNSSDRLTKRIFCKALKELTAIYKVNLPPAALVKRTVSSFIFEDGEGKESSNLSVMGKVQGLITHLRSQTHLEHRWLTRKSHVP